MEFAYITSNDTPPMKFVFEWVEHFEGKREFFGHQHFLHFPQCFPHIFLGVVRSGDRVENVEHFHRKLKSSLSNNLLKNSCTELFNV